MFSAAVPDLRLGAVCQLHNSGGPAARRWVAAHKNLWKLKALQTFGGGSIFPLNMMLSFLLGFTLCPWCPQTFSPFFPHSANVYLVHATQRNVTYAFHSVHWGKINEILISLNYWIYQSAHQSQKIDRRGSGCLAGPSLSACAHSMDQSLHLILY